MELGGLGWGGVRWWAKAAQIRINSLSGLYQGRGTYHFNYEQSPQKWNSLTDRPLNLPQNEAKLSILIFLVKMNGVLKIKRPGYTALCNFNKKIHRYYYLFDFQAYFAAFSFYRVTPFFSLAVLTYVNRYICKMFYLIWSCFFFLGHSAANIVSCYGYHVFFSSFFFFPNTNRW